MDTNLDLGQDSVKIEALESLWLFFWFNRFFGVCPILRHGNTLVYKYIHIYWIPVVFGITGAIVILYLYIYPLVCVPGTSVMPAMRDITYVSHALWNILYMAWFARKLPKFIESCGTFEEKVLSRYKKSSKNDTNNKSSDLVRYCQGLIWVMVFILSLEYLFYLVYAWYETTLIYRKPPPQFPPVEPIPTPFSLYLYFGLYSRLYEGNEFDFFKGLALCLFDMFTYVCWFFADTFLVLSSVIIASYIKRYNDTLEEKTQKLIPLKELEGYRQDFRKITKLIDGFNKDFANLFVLTYIGNIVILFCKLYVGISYNFTKDDHILVKFHVLLRVSMIILKIYLSTWMSAGIHEETKRTLEIVQDAPTEPDCPNPTRLHLVEQFVRHLTVKDIGISCHGFFTITKAFFVALVSAFITYEMVVLEFISTKLDVKSTGVYGQPFKNVFLGEENWPSDLNGSDIGDYNDYGHSTTDSYLYDYQ